MAQQKTLKHITENNNQTANVGDFRRFVPCFYDVNRPYITYKTNGFYCQNFTGKEKDTETGYGYFGARYMDHELMTMWLSVDPMADKYPSISPYAYCAWNPIKLVDPNGEEISDHIDENGYLIAHYDDGDDGVYVHANGTTKTQIDNQREVLGNTGGIGLYIGDLGGEIDVSSVMENKLQESSTIAQTFRGNSKYSLYYDKVHTGGDWDLKNNEKTIWGVAWGYDNTNGTQTTFSCNRFSNASAADVGNYHAGYTGIMAGIGKYMLCKGAGLAETVKSFRNWRIFDGLYRANSLLTPLNLRSGDRKRDYIFNTMGMGDAKKELR